MALDAASVRNELFTVMVVIRCRLVVNRFYARRLNQGTFGKFILNIPEKKHPLFRI